MVGSASVVIFDQQDMIAQSFTKHPYLIGMEKHRTSSATLTHTSAVPGNALHNGKATPCRNSFCRAAAGAPRRKVSIVKTAPCIGSVNYLGIQPGGNLDNRPICPGKI
jgi:hypothetical protein